MQKYILIIIAVAIIIIGFFGYQYFLKSQVPIANVQSNSNIQTVDTMVSEQLSDDVIINAINRFEEIYLIKDLESGVYKAGPSDGYSSYTVKLIAKGDLNEDGLKDAFVYSRGCGGSCGSSFNVIINKGSSLVNIFRVSPDGIDKFGAGASSINNITINNGVISIDADIHSYNKSDINSIFTYKLTGGNLVKIN